MAVRREAARRDESGVIFPLTVGAIAVSLLLASLVIDIGGDRVVRRDMQSVADVVALDLARNLDGRIASGYAGYSSTGPSTTLFATQKAATVDRQDGLLAEPDSVRVRLAIANQQTGAFIRWAGPDEIPNAVRAYASGSSAFRILPTTPEASNVERSALAVTGQPMMCMSVGATLADLTPGGTLDLLLGRLIGLDRLSIVSPSGLASLETTIPLGGLAAQLNLGTVDELMTANVTARSFVAAAASVLANNGNLAAADVMNAIAARLNSTTSLDVSSMLNLTTGAGSAAGLTIDAFNFVQAVIELSNKNNFVALALPVSVPGLASVQLEAKIIESPRIACGKKGTRARSAQIQLRLTADVTTLSGSVASAEIDPLLITIGEGWAEVDEIICTAGSTRVRVLADTVIGRYKLHLLIGLLLGLTEIVVDAPDPNARPDGAKLGNENSRAPLTFVFNSGGTDLPPGQTAGSALGNLGLASVNPIKVKVIGLQVGDVLTGIVQPLLGVIDGLLNPLLNPVLESLGIRLGTVQVRPTTRPACNEPGLRD